jgi:hypothetical protein
MFRKGTAVKRAKKNPSSTTRPAGLESLEGRVLLSTSLQFCPSLKIIPDTGSGPSLGFSPAQIRQAYGFSSATLSNGSLGTGAGQTIAIVDAYNDPSIGSDLNAFDKEFGLPSAPSVKVVNQTGSSSLPASDAGWSTEISLDVEWAHAIAPGAKLLLVEANSASLGDLMNAVNYARNVSSVSVISMSWGSGEFYGETSYDSYFTTPSGHQGITFVAASGDQGSWYGPDWPASSPNVLSVGGTTLRTSNSSGTYSSETAWSGSTGGFSSYESEPGYQNIAQSSGVRTTPDVSFDADPNTGFAVYDSVAYDGYQGWYEMGGTSAGAPQWSSLVAIADQGRALKNIGSLNGSSQTLPLIYSLYTQKKYSISYHDVTAGATSWFIGAQPGCDAATGLGSPKAQVLVGDLVASSSTGTVSVSATTTTKTTTTTSTTTMTTRTGTGRHHLGGARRSDDLDSGNETLSTSAPGGSSATAAPAPVQAPIQTGGGGAITVVSVGSGGAESTTKTFAPIAAVGFTVAEHESSSTSFGTSAALVEPISGTSKSPEAAAVRTAVEPAHLSNPFFPGVAAFSFDGQASNVANISFAAIRNQFDADFIAARQSFQLGMNPVTVLRSTDMMERLLVADASALADVAYETASQVYGESQMLWREIAAVVGAGVLMGTYAMRDRDSRPRTTRAKLPAELTCVGETPVDASDRL